MKKYREMMSILLHVIIVITCIQTLSMSLISLNSHHQDSVQIVESHVEVDHQETSINRRLIVEENDEYIRPEKLPTYKLRVSSDTSTLGESLISEMDQVVDDVCENLSNKSYAEMSESEFNEFAALVYLEAGSTSYECQKAVASAILNMMMVEEITPRENFYYVNRYSPAPYILYTTPSELSIQVCREVLEEGPSIPLYVTLFRTDYYHDWGDRYCNYTSIDNVYFSYDSQVKERLGM